MEASVGRLRFADELIGLTVTGMSSASEGDASSIGLASLSLIDRQGHPRLTSPLPLSYEGPLIRIGSRPWLRGIAVDTEADLSSDPSLVPEGAFEWARETGQTQFSSTDIAKSLPGQTGYELAWLGARIYWDGTARSSQPTPQRKSQVLLAGGSLERERILPSPGIAGVALIADGTGTEPDLSSGVPSVRPSGVGLIRHLNPDSFVRRVGGTEYGTTGSGGAIEKTKIVQYDEDLTSRQYRIPRQTCEISLMSGKMAARHGTETAYEFIDGVLTPSIWSRTSEIFSRNREPFTSLSGLAGKTIQFVVDGLTVLWTVPSFPVGEVIRATDIATLINTSAGVAVTSGVAGHVKLFGVTSVEVSWRNTDIEVAGALGFLPGWRAESGLFEGNFLPDNGLSIQLYRSPANLTQSQSQGEAYDYNANARFDGVITDNVSASPFIQLGDRMRPLEDVPGYTQNQHFKVVLASGRSVQYLGNRLPDRNIGLRYELENGRIAWAEVGQIDAQKTLTITDQLPLGGRVFEETVSQAAMLPTGDASYGLYIQEPLEARAEQISGTDWIPVGQSGAQLIDVIGPVLATGTRGTITGTTVFTDATAQFLTAGVTSGCLIVIDSAVYPILSVQSEHTVVFGVDVSDPWTGFSSWEIHEGFSSSVYDPAIVADRQYVEFNHLDPEPFSVRVLSYLGNVGDNLVADISGRESVIRFGLGHTDPQATIQYLTRGVYIGLAAASMDMSTIVSGDQHYTDSSGSDAYFELRVGAGVYSTIISNMSIVTVFTVGLTGDVIEVGEYGSAISGLVSLGTDVVENNPGQTVFYDQIALPPSLIAAGVSECDVSTGTVTLSEADSLAYPTARVYLVEQMVFGSSAGAQNDARISPMLGALTMTNPLRDGQIVEASYYTAKADGSKKSEVPTTEYLPLVVRLETATRVDSKTYTFNPTGRTIDTRIEPQIWVGVDLQNYAGTTTATVTGSTIVFESDVPSTTAVQINYGVLEAFGGEQAYQVSAPPVYRPPFMLPAGASSFVLEGDRSSELEASQLLLIGSFATYITSVSYDTTAGTTVDIDPAPLGETGSRAPGRDVGLLVSDAPLTDAGFLMLVPSAVFLATAKGATTIKFVGSSIAQFAKTGHLLEIGGMPMVLTGSTVSDDGRYTSLDIGAPVSRNLVPGTDLVKVSVRPMYGPTPSRFSAPSGLLIDQPYKLVLFPSDTDPGIILTSGYDYVIDSTGKNIQLQTPVQTALVPGAKLILWYTARRLLSPVTVDDAVVYPVYGAKFLYGTMPSEANRLYGATLSGRFTYHSPDTFYIKFQTEATFQAEVVKLAEANTPQQPAGGPIAQFPGAATGVSSSGVLGARETVEELRDYDDGARDLIVFYDSTIQAFEQVLETIDGQVIGDRSGKFRFFVGYGRGSIPPPGYVDDITGRLNQRVIWRELIQTWGDGSGYYNITDPIYDPRTNYEPDPVDRPGEVNGLTPMPDVLGSFLAMQALQIRNDMDDVILTGFGRPVGRLISIFPRLDIPGVFLSSWEPSVVSRLFPERTKHFSRLLPGVESETDPVTKAVTDPGFFTPGRKGVLVGDSPVGRTNKNGVTKTRGQPIGRVSNPAIGDINNIQDVTAYPRKARARVWSYFPYGSASLDLALGTSTVGKATLILTPEFLSEFLLDQDTGFPDVSELISNGGGKPDLASGDPDLSTPGFSVGDQVSYGRPSGTVMAMYSPPSSILSDARGSVYIDSIQAGCVITLADIDGNSLSGNEVSISDPNASGDTYSRFSAEYGDTIFVPGSKTSIEPGVYSDPPKLEESGKLADGVGDYRIQFDLKIKKKTGQFADATLPDVDDIWGLPIRTWAGQSPPKPNTTIEGEADFANDSVAPLELPALLGQARDDSGDVTIPYLFLPGAEKQALADAEVAFRGLFLDTATALPIPAFAPVDELQTWKAVYPDERSLNDGVLYAAVTTGKEPATLYTSIDQTPVATAGSYTDNSGLGDVRKFDLILSQVGNGNTLTGGETGILTVGAVTSETLEPPRFVTPTNRGDLHQYTARNLFGSANVIGGVEITELLVFGTYSVTLDFSATPNMVLDDGTGSGTGGVKSILNVAGAGNNVVYVDFYDQSSLAAPGSSYLGSLIFASGTLGGTIYYRTATGVVTPVVLSSNVNLLASTGIFFQDATASLLATLGLSSATPYDFTITVDTYVDATTVAHTGGALVLGSGNGSLTASVNRDRLTFDERVSFLNALPRGSLPANGDLIELGLELDVEVSPVGAGGIASTVNGAAEINGGLPLTFLTRTYGVGQFTNASAPGAGDELGSVRAMSWEGWSNSPLAPITNAILSPMPSSDADETSQILEGVGTIEDDQLVPTLEPYTWIQGVVATTGDLSSVSPGDIVVVDAASSGLHGAVKTGTYLVRHAIDGAAVLAGSTTETYAGDKQALDLRFPSVSSSDLGTLQITLDNVPAVQYSVTGCGFESAGSLYLIIDQNYTTYDTGLAQFVVNSQSVFSIVYTAVVYDQATESAVFTVTAGTALDAAGLPVSDADFFTAASRFPLASGMVFLPIYQMETAYPTNNVVGPDNVLGIPLIAGVRYVTAGNTSVSGAPGSAITWSCGVDLERELDGTVTPAAGNLGVRVPQAEDSRTLTASAETVVYGRKITGAAPGGLQQTSGVATHLDVRSVVFDDIHFGVGATPPGITIPCMMPGDRFRFSDTLAGPIPGFWAITGIFLEPSFPRPVRDLSTSAEPHVVSASNSITLQDDIGIRRAQDYGSGTSEAVHFYVRRVRRWHETQTSIYSALYPLRYVYEMRTGSFDPLTITPTLSITIPTGTTLGFFDDPAVGLKAGDVFRVVNADGLLLDSAEIMRIDSYQTLSFCTPGLTKDLTTAVGFQIYMNNPAVPHQQSCEQLLSLATDSEVTRYRVDYAAPPSVDGGTVPAFGSFTDPSVIDWTLVNGGVSQGDYLIIDPTGPLYTTGEFGQAPVGDWSVQARSAPTWIPGSPVSLDDNRGVYKVTTVSPSALSVTGVSRFSGDSLDGSDNVVFGDPTAEYVVLPTVSNSMLTGNTEGQQTLRETAASVAGSFLDRTGSDLYRSIQPCSYRIIRPNTQFSQDALELILFMRERMLSWIQEIQYGYSTKRDGDYREFQVLDQIEELPSPVDRTLGLGYWPNLLAVSLRGRIEIAPFSNVDDCLSILDRRVWINDTKLDRTYPPSGGPDAYTELQTNGLGQAPVLTDMINDVLDLADGFRQTRYAWIRFRADRINGSIMKARRAAAELPDRLRREEELAAQQRK